MRRRHLLLGGLSLLTLSGCAGLDLGSYGGGTVPSDVGTLPTMQGQTFGTGPVRVALLLPLTGDAAVTGVGTSMAGGAQLAMEYIAGNASMHDNITLVLKDTGGSAQGAAAAANQAVGEGAALILGPLRAEQVTAAGAVARAAGIPLIGFSNNSGAAQAGVYLLNVLPETEVRRTLAYARGLGRRAFAGVFPSNAYGQVQKSAFQQAASDLGLTIIAVYDFADEDQARGVVGQLAPTLLAGQVDALFLPDRTTAPSFGSLLEQASVPAGGIQILGSADWSNDADIQNTPYLAGALYPAIDEAGYNAILPLYQQRFGGAPHRFVTLAYTAAILANAAPLSLATPPYPQGILTSPGGFTGRDGTFRFLADGRSQYALAIRKVQSGGSSTVDAARIV